MTPRHVILIGVVALLACDDHAHTDTGPQADEYAADCETSPASFASDEAFAAVINKEAAGAVIKDDAQAPVLTAPASESVLSAASPPWFTFTGKAVVLAPTRSRRSAPSSWDRAVRALGIEGVAWAHCPAFTGDNYLLRVFPQGGTKAIYTAMLSVTTFQPAAALWKSALTAQIGKKVDVTIVRASLAQNNVIAGPFVRSTAYSFPVSN